MLYKVISRKKFGMVRELMHHLLAFLDRLKKLLIELVNKLNDGIFAHIFFHRVFLRPFRRVLLIRVNNHHS